jgi:hypothetical protein
MVAFLATAMDGTKAATTANDKAEIFMVEFGRVRRMWAECKKEKSIRAAPSPVLL